MKEMSSKWIVHFSKAIAHDRQIRRCKEVKVQKKLKNAIAKTK